MSIEELNKKRDELHGWDKAVHGDHIADYVEQNKKLVEALRCIALNDIVNFPGALAHNTLKDLGVVSSWDGIMMSVKFKCERK